MKHARIAELKARLSEYLRAVRRGETVTVLDRDTPVARIQCVESILGSGVGVAIETSPQNVRLVISTTEGRDFRDAAHSQQQNGWSVLNLTSPTLFAAPKRHVHCPSD